MKWLQQLAKWFKKTFLKVNDQLNMILPIGITVVENIKNFVDSPAADVITTIIQGSWDNAIVAALRKILPKILLELREWKELEEIADENEKIKAIILELGTGTGILTQKERQGLKLQAAAEINAFLAEVNTAQAKVATLVAYHYPEFLKENEAA